MAKRQTTGQRIIASLQDAIAFAQGENTNCVVHIPDEINTIRIREKLNMSPEQFAACLGVSVQKLQKLDQGRAVPSGAVRILLMALDRETEAVRRVLAASMATSSASARGQRKTIDEKDHEIRDWYGCEASQIHHPLVEDPVISSIAAESEAKGRAESLRDTIMEIACDCFSDPVITAVRQTIAPIQNEQQLRKFLRKLDHASNDENALDLLSECFPLVGEIKGLQEAIRTIACARFSSQLVSTIQQAITPVESTIQLKDFLRQLALAPDEQAVPSLLAQFFSSQLSGHPELSAIAKTTPSAQTDNSVSSEIR